ncbi:MAG: hypothetical protein IPK53_04355 [bacterium]|nr:hypothetical protein [bacterium]
MSAVVISFLRKLFDVRPGEEVRSALMFSYSFLLIASLTIVKPVRTSLLLTTHGPGTLPYVFLLIALITPLFVLFYNKASKRIRLNRLIAVTTLASIACLLCIWFLLYIDYAAEWFIFAFYVWVTIFGLITTTQFWLLANYVFNAREAKRLFSVIGSGAIAGGIVGGYLTSVLVTTLHTTGMLHLCMVFLALCLVLQYFIWKRSAHATYGERMRRQDRQRARWEEPSPWSLLLQSRLVLYLSGIVGIGVVVGTLIDYQFSVMASQSISNSDEMTAFFGFWMSSLSIASFLIQILATSRILKSFGVVSALTFLPVVVVAGAGTVMLFPTLWAASALKVGEGGLKQSLHKAGLELLGLPVPMRLKNRVKVLVDVAIDNFATGLAGAIVLLLMFWDFAEPRELSAMILGLAVVWIGLVYLARTDYLNALRQAISKRAIQPEDLSYEIYSSLRADHLIGLLDSKNDKQLLMALGYLENMGDKRLALHLTRLAGTSTGGVLRRVYRIARTIPAVDLTTHATAHQLHELAEVRVAATRYLLRRSNDKTQSIQHFISRQDDRVTAATIVAAAKEWASDNAFRGAVDLREFYGEFCTAIEKDSHSPEIGLAMAEALSIAPQVEFGYCVERLLESDSPEVASHAALSAGRTRDERFVGVLVSQLSDKRLRKNAREALSEYGEPIAERLANVLRDAKANYRERFEIPRILSMIGTQRCFALLTEYLGMQHVKLRYEVIRALNRMRSRDASLKIKAKRLDPVIWAEIRSYYELTFVLDCVERAPTRDAATGQAVARQLLVRTLHEKLTSGLERIFRLLGLEHPPKDMYHAYLGVTSDVPDQRANAIELLELILRPGMRAALIPIAERTGRAELVEFGASLFGLKETSETGALNILLRGDDDWLRTTALHLCWFRDPDAESHDPAAFETHDDSVVRETAARVKRSALTPTVLQSTPPC